MKKFIIFNICIIISAFAFIQGYISAESPVYAATGWENVTSTEELAEAFRYYCKSRDLTIDGSIADGVTKFTTQTFNNLCNRLGLNVTAIQADLKRSTDGNLGVQYLFNSSGIATYNRIFGQFLQDNDLSVGDNVDKDIYDAPLITDYKGNSAFLYLYYDYGRYTNIYKYGSTYIHDNEYISSVALAQNKYVFENGLSNVENWAPYFIANKVGSGNKVDIGLSSNGTSINVNYGSAVTIYDGTVYHGNLALCMSKSSYEAGSKTYEIGVYRRDSKLSPTERLDIWTTLPYGRDFTVQNVTINATTNNNTINNNTYENNTYTTINNEGDVNNYDTEQEPEPGDTPGTNPSPITPPSDSGGSDGDVSFPNFNFKFPEINWSLGDLSSKFPFSIPFDLVAFYTVLNAEPRAPAVDAEIPLGDFYNWHFEADFSQFDNYAVIIRNVEYISFVVALIYITVKFVKG